MAFASSARVDRRRPNQAAGVGRAPGRGTAGRPVATINHPARGQGNSGKPNLGQPKPTVRQKPQPQAQPIVGRSAQPDSVYQGAIDRIERRQEHELGELQGQEQSVRHDFGIEDPTNPFSRVEGLKRAFLARQKAASAGLAAQGQLTSGAHERAVARTRREEEQARAELRRAYEGAIGQIGAAKAGVKFETEEQRAQAFENWLARAPESQAPAPNPRADTVTGGGDVGFFGPNVGKPGTPQQQANQANQIIQDMSKTPPSKPLAKGGKPTKPGKVTPADVRRLEKELRDRQRRGRNGRRG